MKQIDDWRCKMHWSQPKWLDSSIQMTGIYPTTSSHLYQAMSNSFRPDVLPSLISQLRATAEAGSNPFSLPRTLLILLYIVKELSTARLQRSRASLQSATPEIFSVLSGIYVKTVYQWRTFLEKGGEDEGGALDAIEQSLMIIKILRRLLIAGYEFPNRNSEVQTFWTIVKDQFADFFGITMRESSISLDVQQWIEKHLLQLSKLHLEMARVHPAAFVLLPDSMGLVRAYQNIIAQLSLENTLHTQGVTAKIRSDGDVEGSEKSLLEKLSLKGLLLVRACVKMVFSPAQTFKYRHKEEKEEQKEAAVLIRAELLTEDQVRGMAELIITRLFVFRESDIREWNEEPEEWERREESDGDGWEFSIRPCAEKLFLDLVINFKDILIGPILQVFHGISGKSPRTVKVLILNPSISQ